MGHASSIDPSPGPALPLEPLAQPAAPKPCHPLTRSILPRSQIIICKLRQKYFLHLRRRPLALRKIDLEPDLTLDLRLDWARLNRGSALTEEGRQSKSEDKSTDAPAGERSFVASRPAPCRGDVPRRKVPLRTGFNALRSIARTGCGCPILFALWAKRIGALIFHGPSPPSGPRSECAEGSGSAFSPLLRPFASFLFFL